jgi:proteasome lid subunit RPN8/RPN11
MIRIAHVVCQEMIHHAREEWPAECCGLLAGKDGMATRIYPLENLERSPSSYQADPLQQLKALREIEDLGLDLLAIYHSHPHTECYPSRVDIEKAYDPDATYVIVSLKEPICPIRAFRIDREGRVSEEVFEVLDERFPDHDREARRPKRVDTRRRERGSDGR